MSRQEIMQAMGVVYEWASSASATRWRRTLAGRAFLSALQRLGSREKKDRRGNPAKGYAARCAQRANSGTAEPELTRPVRRRGVDYSRRFERTEPEAPSAPDDPDFPGSNVSPGER